MKQNLINKLFFIIATTIVISLLIITIWTENGKFALTALVLLLPLTIITMSFPNEDIFK